MLKNWLVKTKAIKTSFGHISYLSNPNAKSHKSTRIVVLRDCAKTIINANDKRAEFRKENKVKGAYRVKNEATSFILSIPRDITQLSDEQWKKLSDHVLNQLWQHVNKKIEINNKKNLISNLKRPHKKQPILNNISMSDFAKHCHVVLHDESANPDNKNHLHIIVSNIINNDVIKPITQLGATYNIKQSFNYAMKKLVNEDHMNYTPKNSVFDGSDKNFTDKKTVFEQPKNYRFSSTVKFIFTRLQKNFNHWLRAVFNKETLKIKEYAEKTATDINELKSNKIDEVTIILETAKTIEKGNTLPDALKITNKVTNNIHPRKRRRRKKSKNNSPKNN
ncbi:MAG: hypothetical protein OQK09_13235 [Colwellia sp.]|nr:hypothetical protein [Colwellia sp.]MCW8866680.1 hypothetical protein [Colwellia sp.]MCW9082471.1 hypothetical protein [Colwellia sp.]